jgi:hypothetical protein
MEKSLIQASFIAFFSLHGHLCQTSVWVSLPPRIPFFQQYQFKEGTFEKFILRGKETHHDIGVISDRHRYPYQLKNAIKLAGLVFPFISWAKDSTREL